MTRSSSNNGESNDQTTANDSPTKGKYFYLTPKAVATLPKYEYNGRDDSLIYKHILSPLASFLVENATPNSIAPNAITLFGLCFMIVAYYLIWHHCPTLDECKPDHEKYLEVPNWIFAFNGVAMLIYQTLDNMDGKQGTLVLHS